MPKIPEVEAILGLLVRAIVGVLGDELIGLYLYGSAVTGDFDPGVSDVDLVAITRDPAERLDLRGLATLHDTIADEARQWTDRVEVCYVDQGALETPASSDVSLAVISPGEPFHVSGPVSDWLMNWYLVRETGAALVGPASIDVIGPVSRQEFLGAVARYADYLVGLLDREPDPGQVSYILLSMCRCLRTVRTGFHASKKDAALFVRERTPETGRLIDEALDCRLSGGKVGLQDPASRSAAADLVRRLAGQVRQSPTPIRCQDEPE